MLSSSLLMLGGAALSAAQAAFSSTTASPSGPVVSLFLPDTDPQKLVASVIGSSGSMTTYVITCPEGTDASDCGYSDPVTITEGASRLLYSQVVPDFTASIDCTLTGSTAGICVESFGGSGANFPGLSTTTLQPSDITFFPVTVTAGLAGSGTGAVATMGTVSETGAAASSTLLSGTAQATSSSTSASAGAATSSSASTGGAASRGRDWGLLGLFSLAFVCSWEGKVL